MGNWKINPASIHYTPLLGVLENVCLVLAEHKAVVLSLYQYPFPSQFSKQASKAETKPEDVGNIPAEGDKGCTATGCVKIRNHSDSCILLDQPSPGWRKEAAGLVVTCFSGKSLLTQAGTLLVRTKVGEVLVSGLMKLPY